jgi:proteasome lid subunit RPN8/RPN11
MSSGVTPPPLIVPADTVRLTAALLRSPAGMEACCFWFGRRLDSGAGQVDGIVVPRQQNHQGHYHVTSESMLQVAKLARPRGWKNLAQIHSHPGTMVRHSGYDDEMANSRRALSIVYPCYGMVPGAWRFRGWLWGFWPRAFPHEIGVHAFTNDRWTFLDQVGIRNVLRLTAAPRPAFIDLRS